MTKHGHGTPNKTREYRSWQSMKARCYYQGNPEYHRYGGLGVTICERWRDSFENFLADLVHPSGIEGLIILARGPRYSARGFPA
jgi:hypothetical protein